MRPWKLGFGVLLSLQTFVTPPAWAQQACPDAEFGTHDEVPAACVGDAPIAAIDQASGLCEVSGGAGWTNQVHTGGGVAFSTPASAQACCLSCVANPDCTQWIFSNGVCQQNVPAGNECGGPLESVIDSGRIRCPNEGGGPAAAPLLSPPALLAAIALLITIGLASIWSRRRRIARSV